MRKAFGALAAIGLALCMQGAAADELLHVRTNFAAVAGSGVSGHVSLVQLPHGGTLITVVASGLRAEGSYVSLYYDNDVCEIEPYSADDVVGTYTANRGGIGHAVGKVDDDLDEINSVSVRNAEDFSLLACAKVH